MVQITGTLALAALPALSQAAAATGLNAAAKAAGLVYFGTATDNNEITDTAYLAAVSDTNQFGQITPANSQKWGPSEPVQGQPSYAQGDQIVALAEKNGQLVRCHNLIWHDETPSWLDTTTWTNETLIAAIQEHITSEVTHYKGQCRSWDVVNEPLDDTGAYVNWTVYNVIGPAYIPIAFAAAAAADPEAKLYLNDYNVEYGGAKQTAYLQIVSDLKASGIKIDGFGFESHFSVGTAPSANSLQTIMDSFGALGVETAITELDVRETLPSTAAQDAQQALDYVSIVQACLQAKSCVGTTVWDFVDEYSWVPSTFTGQGSADLFNGTGPFTAKPAYYSVLSLLNAHATAGAPAASPTSTSVVQPTTLSTKTSAAPTSTSVVKPTTAKTSSSAPAATGAAHYAQCGGQGWKGATSCAAPYTCKASNNYYSQCL